MVFGDDKNRMSDQHRAPTRRRMVQTIGALAVIGATGSMPSHASAAESNDACPAGGRMTVWRLASEWEEPRGPHGKTRLESRASRNAATHRWALTEQDALDMNLHLCSWAPAVSVEVNNTAFIQVWNELAYDWENPWNGKTVRILDDRCLPHMEDGEDIFVCALAGATTSDPAPTPTPNEDPTPSAEPATAGNPPPALAFTGTTTGTLVAAGAGTFLAGLAARRAAVARSNTSE